MSCSSTSKSLQMGQIVSSYETPCNILGSLRSNVYEIRGRYGSCRRQILKAAMGPDSGLNTWPVNTFFPTSPAIALLPAWPLSHSPPKLPSRMTTSLAAVEVDEPNQTPSQRLHPSPLPFLIFPRLNLPVHYPET